MQILWAIDCAGDRLCSALWVTNCAGFVGDRLCG